MSKAARDSKRKRNWNTVAEEFESFIV